MAVPQAIERRRLAVAGADSVLETFIEEAMDAPPGVAAARTLAHADIDWRSIRDDALASDHSIIVAERDDGPLLAVRAFQPNQPTPIHDHGTAGAARVVEGRSRYERFRRSLDITATLESTHELLAGDVIWWNDPPDDLHRQVAVEHPSIELVLVARPPLCPTTYDDASPVPSALAAAVTRAFLDGDAGALEPWYAEDVLADLHVPQWRFQARGRAELLGLIEQEEFSKPDRRLYSLRLTETSSGLVVEIEQRFTQAGSLRRFHELHHLRCRDQRVVEHAVWCTGIADETAIDAQLHNAWMERS